MKAPEAQEIQPGVWLIHQPGTNGIGDFRLDIATTEPVVSLTNEAISDIVTAIFENEERTRAYPEESGGMMFLEYLASRAFKENPSYFQRHISGMNILANRVRFRRQA